MRRGERWRGGSERRERLGEKACGDNGHKEPGSGEDGEKAEGASGENGNGVAESEAAPDRKRILRATTAIG